MDRVVAIPCRVMLYGGAVVALLSAAIAPAVAQDSVAMTPGASDALSAYGAQRQRYTVMATSFTSSWGNNFIVAPVLKSTRSVDPLFNTNQLGANAISAETARATLFPLETFSTWSTAGAGVNPTENTPPASAAIAVFDRRFGAGVTAVAPGASEVIAATIGIRLFEPRRLWVERVVAAASRPSIAEDDTACLALGAVDTNGVAALRVDDFGVLGGVIGAITDDHVALIDTPLRVGGVVNALSDPGGGPAGADAAATTFRTSLDATLAMPTLAPRAVTFSGASEPVTLGFDPDLRYSAADVINGFLDASVTMPRGSASYAGESPLGGSFGAYACLAVASGGAGFADTINLFELDDTGAVLGGPIAATLPAPFIDGAFTANDPVFTGWLSQTCFRGPSGLVGVGATPLGAPYVAAVAQDSVAGEFIAACDLTDPQTPVWRLIAKIDTLVRDGPNGAQIGRIVSGATLPAPSPVTFSAPAVDRFGNVYFTAAYKPTLGGPQIGFFKAVHTPAGPMLERILQTGMILVGQNSQRPYQIIDLALGDSNSVSSGAFHHGALLQEPLVAGVTDPADPRAFGGALVNATIQYDNAAAPEEYDVAIYVGPKIAGRVIGDANDDGVVTPTDLALLLGAWGSSNPIADFNSDGVINPDDLGLLLGNWTN